WLPEEISVHKVGNLSPILVIEAMAVGCFNKIPIRCFGEKLFFRAGAAGNVQPLAAALTRVSCFASLVHGDGIGFGARGRCVLLIELPMVERTWSDSSGIVELCACLFGYPQGSVLQNDLHEFLYRASRRVYSVSDHEIEAMANKIRRDRYVQAVL